MDKVFNGVKMRRFFRTSSRALKRGFTLVELLIVAIILAVLAAIVIPQFSSSTVDAREAALDANLNVLRSAIELYRVQHNNVLPGVNATSGLTCTVGAAGAAAVNTAAALIDQLTRYSNAAGQTCTGADPQTRLGPYLRKGFPNEPITNSSAIAIETTGIPLAPSSAVNGWFYNTVTGQIVMNSNANDSRGVAYSTR